MKVVVDSVSKKVNVEYNLSHIGHDTRLGHLRISDELRLTVAAKLAKKIPVNAIPDESFIHVFLSPLCYPCVPVFVCICVFVF